MAAATAAAAAAPTPAAQWAALLPPAWQDHVTRWIAEDAPSFDYGGFVVGTKQDTAFLLGKAPVRPATTHDLSWLPASSPLPAAVRWDERLIGCAGGTAVRGRGVPAAQLHVRHTEPCPAASRVVRA